MMWMVITLPPRSGPFDNGLGGVEEVYINQNISDVFHVDCKTLIQSP